MILLAVVRLVLRRLFAMPTLAAVWLSSSLLAIGLIVNMPLFSEAVSLRVLHEDLQQRAGDRPPFAIHLYRSWDPFRRITGQEFAQYRQVTDFVRHEHALISLPVRSITGRVESAPFNVAKWQPSGAEEMRGLRYRIGFVDDFFEHVTVVHGRLPQPTASADTPIEVLASVNESIKSGVWLEDQYVLVENLEGARGVEPARLQVKVVGFWRAKDEQEAYWFTKPDEWTGLFIVSPDTYERAVAPAMQRPVGFASWYLVYDDRPLRASQVAELMAGSKQLIARVSQYMPGARSDLYNPLAILEAFEPRYRSLLFSLLLFNLPIVAATLYALATTAGLIVSAQRAETATLRSRGASRAQVVGLHILQSALLALVSIAPGLLLAQLLTRLMGQAVSFLTFTPRPPLDQSLEQHHVWIAGAVAVLVTVAAIPPAWRDTGLTLISYQAERARERSRPVWERLYLDVLLFIPAAYGYWQLRQTNTISLFQRVLTNGGTPYEDPLMYIVPVFFIAAGAMLLMRLLPLAFHLLLLAVHRFAGLSPSLYLSLIHLARHPRYYTGPLLVLVLMTSLGVYTAAVARTLDANLRDRTLYAVGSDLVLAERPPAASRAGASEDTPAVKADTTPTRTVSPWLGESMWVLPFDVHRSFPGVTAAARVGRYSTNYRPDKNRGPAELLAIETSDFHQVTFWRTDFGAQDLAMLLSRLAEAPHNILVPRQYLAQSGSRIGEELRLSVDVIGSGEWVELPFVIAGAFEYFPTVYPSEKVTLIANLPYLAEEIGGVGYYDVWLRTTSGARSEAIVAQVQQQLGLAVPTVRDARRTIQEAERRPERTGFFGTLSAGVLGVGGLAIASYALFALLSIRRRSIELGVLRSLGLGRGEVVCSVLYEQFITLVIATVAAIALGILAAHIFIPFVEVGHTSREQVPPYLIHIALSDLSLILVIVAFALLITIAVVIAVVMRQRLGEALRVAG